jgi:hypothetical protein
MTSLDSDPQRLAMAKSGGPARFAASLRTSTAFAMVLATSLLLGGCAVLRDMKDWFSHDTKPPPPVVAAPVTPPPPVPTQLPKPKPVTHESAKPEKPPEKLAEVDPTSLIGLDPPTVEKLLGAPSKISKSEISLVWTFSAPSCSFQIFFYPDVKTSALHALKYGGVDGNGAQVAMSEQCIRGILTAKTNAPG